MINDESSVYSDTNEDPVFTFISKNKDSAYSQLMKELKVDPSEITPAWFGNIESMIYSEASTYFNKKSLNIIKQMLKIIQEFSNNRNDIEKKQESDPPLLAPQVNTKVTLNISSKTFQPKYKLVSQVIFDSYEELLDKRLETEPIPFDIGLALLKNEPIKEEMSATTRKAVEKLEDDAIKIGAKVLCQDDQIQILNSRLNHWKHLAQMRLQQLEQEIHFRQYLIFEQSSIHNFNHHSL